LLSGDATPLEDAPDVDADTAESASTMEPNFLPPDVDADAPDVDADAPDLDGQDCAVDAEVQTEIDAEDDTDAPPAPTPPETVQAADPPGA